MDGRQRRLVYGPLIFFLSGVGGRFQPGNHPPPPTKRLSQYPPVLPAPGLLCFCRATAEVQQPGSTQSSQISLKPGLIRRSLPLEPQPAQPPDCCFERMVEFALVLFRCPTKRGTIMFGTAPGPVVEGRVAGRFTLVIGTETPVFSGRPRSVPTGIPVRNAQQSSKPSPGSHCG